MRLFGLILLFRISTDNSNHGPVVHSLVPQIQKMPFESPSLSQRVELVLNLILPSIIIWLTGFYAFFHCFLNACAEIAYFADRKFYGAWWNATSMDEFWRLWNIPVHEFCHRHLFAESKHYLRVSSVVANLIVFFVSAVLHELLFGLHSIAFRTTRTYFFWAMLMQAPIIFVSRLLLSAGSAKSSAGKDNNGASSEKIESNSPASSANSISSSNNARRWGNVSMWISLLLGQPVIELLYFSEWLHRNMPAGGSGNIICPTRA